MYEGFCLGLGRNQLYGMDQDLLSNIEALYLRDEHPLQAISVFTREHQGSAVMKTSAIFASLQPSY